MFMAAEVRLLNRPYRDAQDFGGLLLAHLAVVAQDDDLALSERESREGVGQRLITADMITVVGHDAVWKVFCRTLAPPPATSALPPDVEQNLRHVGVRLAGAATRGQAR